MAEIVWLILDMGLVLLSVLGLVLLYAGLDVFRFYLPMYFIYLFLFLLVNYAIEEREDAAL